MATTLLLTRHGETDWNREHRWQGHAQTSLNATGRDQARTLARALAADPPAAVYSSDLPRSRETAEIVASSLGLPVQLDARLREVDVGEWSGLTSVEVEERFPDGFERRRAGATGWEQGEEYEAMSARVVAALLEIAARHEGGRVLVVTHGGPIVSAQVASGSELEDGLSVPNCHVLPIRVEGRMIARID
jgi:probable phosphoglycerate mutase